MPQGQSKRKKRAEKPLTERKREGNKIRTSISLPEPLYRDARAYVEMGISSADSINSFFVAAISTYVKLIKRKQIDAAFAGMAHDDDYQSQSKQTAKEFFKSDWQALNTAEGNR